MFVFNDYSDIRENSKPNSGFSMMAGLVNLAHSVTNASNWKQGVCKCNTKSRNDIPIVLG